MQDQFSAERRIACLVILILYFCCVTSAKVSNLLFYTRISRSTTYRQFTRASIALIVTACALGAAYISILVAVFISTNGFSDREELVCLASIRKQDCISASGLVLTAACADLLLNLIIAGIPTWLFWLVRLEIRKKIGLVLLIGNQYLVCASGVSSLEVLGLLLSLMEWQAVLLVYVNRLLFKTYDISCE